jgi:hypothetical protein
MTKTIAKKPASLDVWCERCCIRIAPNEDRSTSGGKVYHVRCGPKDTSETAGADRLR